MFRPAVLLISLSLVVTWGLPLRAETDDPCVADPVCKTHEDKGLSFSSEKDYASALVEFQAAYERAPIPRLLINIGRSFFRIGKPREALEYYSRYSRAETNPDPEIAQKLQRYIEEAQRAASEQRSIDEKRAIVPSVTLPLEEKSSATRLGLHARPFPVGPSVLLSIGAVSLSIGIGLGSRALGLSGEVVENSGPFNEGLYDQGLMFNQAAIALDVLGGASLAAGGIWLGVWLSRHRPTSGERAASFHSVAQVKGKR